jgi:hypothetical protein
MCFDLAAPRLFSGPDLGLPRGQDDQWRDEFQAGTEE